MKEWKAVEKEVQKMTRNGVMTQNLATGETKSFQRHDVWKGRSAPKAEQNFSPKGSADTPKSKRRRNQQRLLTQSDGTAEKPNHTTEPATTKPSGSTSGIPISVRPGTAVHHKIAESEQENVGVAAGHRGEQLLEHGTENALKASTRHLRSCRAAQFRAETSENSIPPGGTTIQSGSGAQSTSNPISKRMQKKWLQRSAGDRIRQAEQRGSQTAKAGKAAARHSRNLLRRAKQFAGRHRKGLLIAMGIGVCLFLLVSGTSSLATVASSGASGVLSTSYLSEDADMLAAEAAYAEMEQNLQTELDEYAQQHPEYDECQFELDSIGHDPYVLISILSALHQGAFTIDEVQTELSWLFEKQYILTEQVRTETRSRTETRTEFRTVTDPDTGEERQEEYTVEEQVPYQYTICTVKLENFNLSHVPIYILSEEELSLYAGYMSTLGNREDLFAGNPNASGLRQPDYYDIPPEALEDEQFAAMMAEATKYIGFPYVWGGSNPSTSFDCSGFVCWVINHSGWNVGRLTATGLYQICTPVSTSQAKPGDLVFFVGTYNTDGCSHVGIYVGNNTMLHCGDPISYADLSSSYWQAHFYSFGRLPS